LFGDGNFSGVLILEVGIDLGLLGVEVILEVEFSLVLLSIGFSTILEGLGVIHLVLSSIDVCGDIYDLSTELSMFKIELITSFYEFLLVFLLVGGELIE